MGGGTEIALACDLVVASQEASFGLPEVKRGLLAAAGGVVRLQRQIPVKLALQMALTGDPVPAATALRWGLVNDVVPAGEVVARALELAGRVAANAPLSVQFTKKVMYQAASGGSDWDPAWNGRDPWAVNAEAMKVVFASGDATEGATAFAQKRPPGPARERSAHGSPGHRDGLHRPGPVRGHAAGGPGRRRRPGRPARAGRRPARATPTATSARPGPPLGRASTSSTRRPAAPCSASPRRPTS